LNNHPSVSKKARENVLGVISTLNYQPSKLARSLSAGFDAVLVVYTRPAEQILDNPYFSIIVSAIGGVAEENEFDLIVQSSVSEEKEIRKTISMIEDKLVKGIILLSSRIDDPLIEALSLQDIPTVVIGKVPERVTASHILSVDTDNYADCKEVGNYLISLGHSKIGCIHAPMKYYVNRERVFGIQDALNSQHITFDEAVFVDGGHTLESSYQTALKLLCTGKGKELTAVFATDDLKALGVYKAAKSLAIPIPEKLSVVGHNDYAFSQLITPQLTTVTVPVYELGIVAASKLFSYIRHERVATRVMLTTELKKRESVKNLNL
jgi:DNA-binding LacI/PurR family transcriptional regulator